MGTRGVETSTGLDCCAMCVMMSDDEQSISSSSRGRNAAQRGGEKGHTVFLLKMSSSTRTSSALTAFRQLQGGIPVPGRVRVRFHHSINTLTPSMGRGGFSGIVISSVFFASVLFCSQVSVLYLPCRRTRPRSPSKARPLSRSRLR